MLCEYCQKNQATIHTRESVNGHSQEHHYCSQCAEQLEPNAFSLPHFFTQSAFSGNAFTTPTMAHLLQDFFATPSPQNQQYLKQEEISSCENCGMSWADFQANGLLGCSHCYRHFGNHMPALLRRLHGHTEHVGKVATEDSVETKEPSQLEQLKKELAQAVAAEEFEQACELRDKIRQLSEESGNKEDGDHVSD